MRKSVNAAGFKSEFKEIGDWLTKVRLEASQIQNKIEDFPEADENEFLLQVYGLCDFIIDVDDKLKTPVSPPKSLQSKTMPKTSNVAVIEHSTKIKAGGFVDPDAITKVHKISSTTAVSNVDNTLKKFKDIVTNHSAKEIDGVLVDVTTANAIVTVAEGLSEENRNKFLNLPITKMASVAWKVLEKAKS